MPISQQQLDNAIDLGLDRSRIAFGANAIDQLNLDNSLDGIRNYVTNIQSGYPPHYLILFCELAVVAFIARKVMEDPQFEITEPLLETLRSGLIFLLNSFAHQ